MAAMALFRPSPTLLTSAALITAPASLVKDLLKRDSLQTCGWISGDSNRPLTCAEGLTCSRIASGFAATAGMFACCNEIACPNNWGLCQAPGGTDMCSGLPAATCSSIYGSITTCPASAPNCFQYALSDSLSASATYFSLDCGGPSITDSYVLALASMTDGAATGAGGDSSSTAAATAGIGTIASTIGNTLLDSPTSTAESGSSSNGGNTSGGTTNGSTSSSQKMQLSTGVIAIIAIAGVILLVICAVTIWCMRRRYKRRYDAMRPVHQPYGPGSVAYQPTMAHSQTTAEWVGSQASYGQGLKWGGSTTVAPDDSISNVGSPRRY